MQVGWTTGLALLILTVILYSIFLIAPRSRDYFRKGYPLDVWISLFTWVLPTAALIVFGWEAFAISVFVELVYLFIFCGLHGLFWKMKKGISGGKLRKVLGHSVGPLRVILGFNATLLALPLFLIIRGGQLTVYPLLVAFLGFPKYRQAEWIQLSRDKFDGLVGLDLLWCLYCEWAAGVYSLGGEMVRNNESFWCPIRFSNDKHCDNCTLAFPDMKQWIAPDKNIDHVAELLSNKYPKGLKVRGWYGHPHRTPEDS